MRSSELLAHFTCSNRLLAFTNSSHSDCLSTPMPIDCSSPCTAPSITFPRAMPSVLKHFVTYSTALPIKGHTVATKVPSHWPADVTAPLKPSLATGRSQKPHTGYKQVQNHSATTPFLPCLVHRKNMYELHLLIQRPCQLYHNSQHT